MKRIIFILLMALGFALTSSAQVIKYRAQTFALARVYNGNYSWGDWQRSNIVITIDYNNDKIYIHSSSRQVYRVIDTTDAYTDNGGGTQVKFYVIDQDGDRGTVRLRIERDGTSQIYIDFSDIAWVYGSVIRIS